jgi:hypothetical protein
MMHAVNEYKYGSRRFDAFCSTKRGYDSGI